MCVSDNLTSFTCVGIILHQSLACEPVIARTLSKNASKLKLVRPFIVLLSCLLCNVHSVILIMSVLLSIEV